MNGPSARMVGERLAQYEGWRRDTTAAARAQAEAQVPPEEAEEGRRRREWRRRMRESREALERAPVTAEGYRQMERLGGTIRRGERGQIVVDFPEGGMRRP